MEELDLLIAALHFLEAYLLNVAAVVSVIGLSFFLSSNR